MTIQLHCLPYEPVRITSRFGPRNTGIAGASTDHKGIDLGADRSKYPGTTDGGPVAAALPGTVTTSAYNSARGYYVIVNHGTIEGVNVKTLYQHLVAGSNLAVGKTVKAGDTVGRMGNTGVGAQLHLHFEVQINNVPVDPEPYLYNIKEDNDMTEAQVREIVKEMLAGDGKVPAWAEQTKEWQKAIDEGIIATSAQAPANPTAVTTKAEVAAMILRSK